MIKDDPNYRLPKDAFIRLFDNPIPAGDPARSGAPEWAQELDEVVVWAHMGDNGQVSVKVNGEDIGGGGGSGFTTATVTLTDDVPDVPTVINEGGLDVIVTFVGSLVTEITVPVPCILSAGEGKTVTSITGSYEQLVPNIAYIIKGDCTVTVIEGEVNNGSI